MQFLIQLVLVLFFKILVIKVQCYNQISLKIDNHNLNKIDKDYTYREYLNNDMIHCEIRNKGIKGIFGNIYFLPKLIKPKPLAKSGFRPKSINATKSIIDFINQNFENDNHKNNNKDDNNLYKISVFVYVWTKPKLRGKYQLADYLLQKAVDCSIKRGDDYMLLIHDDNGSGKLINYYKQRGFLDCSNIIDKGLIAKLI